MENTHHSIPRKVSTPVRSSHSIDAAQELHQTNKRDNNESQREKSGENLMPVIRLLDKGAPMIDRSALNANESCSSENLIGKNASRRLIPMLSKNKKIRRCSTCIELDT